MENTFRVSYFWSKDPDGLDPLNMIDEHSMELNVIQTSYLNIAARYWGSVILKILRIFYEIFHLDPESTSIPLFLNIPETYFDWHGEFFPFVFIRRSYNIPQDFPSTSETSLSYAHKRSLPFIHTGRSSWPVPGMVPFRATGPVMRTASDMI